MCQCSVGLLLQHLIYLHKKRDNEWKRERVKERVDSLTDSPEFEFD